jgi:hypothetical protein
MAKDAVVARDIGVSTVADLRRALSVPGVIVLVDRNDMQAERIMRDPAFLARVSMPRTVVEVRSADVVLDLGGELYHMEIPKAAALAADGTNSFSMRWPAPGGRGEPDRLISYRIEMPGTPGAALGSRLVQSHPPLTPAQLEAETVAREQAQALGQERMVRREEEMQRLAQSPMPVQDPRWPALQAAMEQAIVAATARGLYYNRDVDEAVLADTSALEFAVSTQLPDLELVDGKEDEFGSAVLTRRATLELGSQPRGTWQRIVVQRGEDGYRSSSTIVSSGRSEPAHVYEGSFADRGASSVLRRLVESEVYDTRRRLDQARSAAANTEAMEAIRPVAGTVYRNLRIGQHSFSTATVTSVDDAAGSLVMECRKRGSARTYKATLTASQLAAVLPKAPAEAGTPRPFR